MSALESSLSIRNASIFILGLLVAVTVGAGSVTRIPRAFGALQLGMDGAEFARVTGVRIVGTCASCVKDESTNDLPAAAAATFLNVAAPGLSTSDSLHVFFYRGKLEALVVSLTDRPGVALSRLRAKFGLPSKVWHLKARGDCGASDQYLWRDPATEVLLTSNGSGDDRESSISFRDRRLTAAVDAAGPPPGEPDDCGA